MAAAPKADVIHLWTAGYHAQARNLHKTAKRSTVTYPQPLLSRTHSQY